MGARRLVPLSGVLAVILIFAGFGAAGNAPKGTASTAEVVDYYGKHATAQTTSGVLMSFGALLFLVFAAAFVARLRAAHGTLPGAPALCLVGAGVLAVGLGIYAGLAVSMADVADHVDGSALQTLNVLADDAVFVYLITIGTSAFLFGGAALVLTTGLVSRWLGWLAIAAAVIGMIPSHVLGGALDHVGLAAFAGLGLWTLCVGVILPTPSEDDVAAGFARSAAIYDRPVDECRLTLGGEGFHGKQGLDYFSGVSAESAGARAICVHLLRLHPGRCSAPAVPPDGHARSRRPRARRPERAGEHRPAREGGKRITPLRA